MSRKRKLRCRLGWHRWSPWYKVGEHIVVPSYGQYPYRVDALVRTCWRKGCGEQQKKIRKIESSDQ